MKIVPIVTHHFVKNEDLNHHGTLYAGRTTEWFVESGLMSAAAYVPAENIVCVKIHGMNFTKPVHLGDTVRFVSKIVYCGKTSLTSNIQMSVANREILNGFITFVNVDEDGKPAIHKVELEVESTEDKALQEEAKRLCKR